jgi:ABC-type transport system involved in cytochrome c biogenesis permease subunit
MMTEQNVVYFAANLVLFALVLLQFGRLTRPRWVTDKMLLGVTLVFLGCQAAGLIWSGIQLGPWAFADTYLTTMFLTEAGVLVYLLQERSLRQTHLGPSVSSLAFTIHAFTILFIPSPVRESSHISPWQDCQTFSRRALVIGYPWLCGSLVTGALWAQSAWGAYSAWQPGEVWVLIVWLVLTLTLHSRHRPAWQGRPLAVLSLLGLALILVSLPLLGHTARTGW